MEELQTISDVAKWLNVHPNTVRRLVRAGALQGIRITARGDLRFRAEDVQAYIAKQRTLIPA